jgi:murein DD-endopeptidase MepM/ murein hydrolase activator NlpD
MHQGVDYRARYGTPVYSVANGKVVSARYSGGWGNEIRIRHNNGLVTQYAHLSSMSVRAGQSVRKGQMIGRVGSTGKSTGAHLHFGLVQGKSYINPNKLKMVGTEQLDSAQMAAFQEQIAEIKRKLASLGAA